MNFDEAVKAHLAWKTKLKGFLAKPDGALDPKIVASDYACDLGKWIHGIGKTFAATPEYRALLVAHENFHKAAAQIVTKAKTGLNVTEEVALGSQSEFAATSSKVVGLIMDMKRKAG